MWSTRTTSLTHTLTHTHSHTHAHTALRESIYSYIIHTLQKTRAQKQKRAATRAASRIARSGVPARQRQRTASAGSGQGAGSGQRRACAARDGPGNARRGAPREHLKTLLPATPARPTHAAGLDPAARKAATLAVISALFKKKNRSTLH